MDWPTAIALCVGLISGCTLCSVMVMAWSGKWDKPRSYSITDGTPHMHYTRTVTEYERPGSELGVQDQDDPRER